MCTHLLRPQARTLLRCIDYPDTLVNKTDLRRWRPESFTAPRLTLAESKVEYNRQIDAAGSESRVVCPPIRWRREKTEWGVLCWRSALPLRDGWEDVWAGSNLAHSRAAARGMKTVREAATPLVEDLVGDFATTAYIRLPTGLWVQSASCLTAAAAPLRREKRKERDVWELVFVTESKRKSHVDGGLARCFSIPGRPLFCGCAAGQPADSGRGLRHHVHHAWSSWPSLTASLTVIT